MDLKDAKSNFFSAARYGMKTQFIWNGKKVSSQDLILNELLPMAYKGLYKMNVSPKDVEYYLTIIENRVASLNGSEWMTNSYRNLLKSKKRYEALQVLTANMYLKQEHDYPISTWNVLKQGAKTTFDIDKKVHHIMIIDVLTVDKKDSLELVINIMKWKNIHHVPVINDNKELVGLLSWSDVAEHVNEIEESINCVENYMKTDIITITKENTVEEAKSIMQKNAISCLPVVKKNRLVGIITSKDF